MACPASYVADVVTREVAAGRARRGPSLAGFGGPRDVAAGVGRYRAAGAANPMITNTPGTDLRPTLPAAAAA